MPRAPCTRAAQPKTITLCPMWHFGGPHQWNSRDVCQGCGITRTEARVLAKFKVQPSVGVDTYGHPPPAGWTIIAWPVPDQRAGLRLAVDNTRGEKNHG